MPLAGSGLSADQPLSDMLKIPFHSSFHKVLSIACFFSAAFAPTLAVSRLLQFQVLQLPVHKQRRVFFPETALQKMTARLYNSIMGQCFQGNWHSPDKLAASPLSRSYHGIPGGYEEHLSCEYHFHQVPSCNTPFRPSGTSKHVRNPIGRPNYGLSHTDHMNSTSKQKQLYCTLPPKVLSLSEFVMDHQ